MGEIERLREALRPFAEFRIEGFPGPVVEVSIPSPSNPSTRIEGLLVNYFRLAAKVYAETNHE